MKVGDLKIMQYLVYKTTNNINEKIYIGVHETNNINDSYLGSGELLIKAIKKYGINNFKRIIIAIFDNKKELTNQVKSLIDGEEQEPEI